MTRRSTSCWLLNLCSRRRGIFWLITCALLFMALSQTHWINKHIKAGNREKLSAGHIRRMDPPEVPDNAGQVAPTVKEDKMKVSQKSTGITEVENIQGQIVKLTDSKAKQNVSDVRIHTGNITASTEEDRTVEDSKALQMMTDAPSSLRPKAAVTKEDQVELLKPLYNKDNVLKGSRSDLKTETGKAAHTTPTVLEACLSQTEYERQLIPDKEREKRLAAWASAAYASSQFPILPDKHWKLCEPRRHTFKYRISQADFCTKHQPTTVILILSSPYTTTRRDQIRASWAKWMAIKNHTIACVFLFGQLTGENPETLLTKQKILYTENQRYRDIVQADFVDSYANLTYKTLMGFDWVSRFCPQAKYVLKLDDDVTEGLQTKFVNFVQSHRTSNAIWCMGWKGVANDALRDAESKWCVTYTQYPEQKYPVYCSGSGGYGMETSTAKRLLTSSYETRLFWLEDTYVTGILRRRLKDIKAYRVRYSGAF